MGCRTRVGWQLTYSSATAQLRNGDAASAAVIARNGAKEAAKEQPIWNWKFRILEAQALLRNNAQPANALALLDGPVPTAMPTDLIARKNLLTAQLECNLNRVADGERMLKETEPSVSGDPLLLSEFYYVSGDCRASHDLGGARPFFEKAAQLAHSRDGYHEARALAYLGYLLREDQRFDEAVDVLKSGLSVTDSPWLKELLLGDLGECFQSLGDWTTAMTYSQQAEQIAAGVRDGTKDRARWLIDLGRERFSQIQYSAAEDAWLKALDIANASADTDLKGRCLVNLAMLALKQGDQQHAQTYIKQADDLHLQGEQQLYLRIDRAKLAELQQNNPQAEELLMSILSNHPVLEIKYEAETDLAALYVSEKRFADAEKMFQSGISTAEQAFAQIGSEESRISFLDYFPFYDEFVRFLVGQGRSLDALNIAEHGRSRALAAGLKMAQKGRDRDLNLRAIQHGLNRGQAVLAYWLNWTTESYLWLITPTQVRLFKLAPEKEIDDAVDAYSEEVLQAGSARESRLGEKLYNMLVAPAEKYLPKGSQVIIVPHRRLYKLNFETLVVSHAAPHYWIEDVCIQYASFLAILEHHRKAQPHYAKDLLLIGAPVQASKDFPGLAHAPEEMVKIAAHFPHSRETVIEGAPATPAAYQSSDPSQYRFFHFVTHGTASDASPLDSAIILSPSSKGYKLYAREIIKTKIHPELVTISACYGAGTRQYSGEGLVGLAWAFMRVGAHYVVAALWEVDDAATADLMDQFYAELRSGKTEAMALRDAKLAMLHSNGPRKRPYYWASLQLQTGP